MRRSAFLSGVLLSLACTDYGVDPAELEPVATISLRPATAALQIGQNIRLTPTLQDANGVLLSDRRVTWTSSRPDIATVASGLVTGVNDGEAVITAAVDGRSASSRITVQLVVTEILITPEFPVVSVGSSVQLRATPLSPEGDPIIDRVIRWRSLNPEIAGVSVGKVTGRRPGSAEILASVDERTATVTVRVMPRNSEPVPPPAPIRATGASGPSLGR